MNPTKARRVTRAEWEEAQAAWDAWGRDASRGMREEWREWRHLAAMEAGILGPPEGGRWDPWTAGRPSQLAILTRAIRETPEALRAAIRAPRVRSWAAVIAVLLRGRDEQREALELEHEHELRRRDEATRREAAEAIGSVLARLDRGWDQNALQSLEDPGSTSPSVRVWRFR